MDEASNKDCSGIAEMAAYFPEETARPHTSHTDFERRGLSASARRLERAEAPDAAAGRRKEAAVSGNR